MNSIKYLKLDLRMIKSQWYWALFTFAVAPILAIKMNMIYLGFAFLFLGAMAMLPIPFNAEKSFKSGFYELLPATTQTKVLGRYLFLVTLSSISALACYLLLTAARFWGIQITKIEVFIILTIMLMVFCIECVQYIIYYKIETFKNPQIANGFKAIPLFIVMFGSSFFSDWITDNLSSVPAILNIINKQIIAIFFVEIGIMLIILLVSIFASVHICEKKEIY